MKLLIKITFLMLSLFLAAILSGCDDLRGSDYGYVYIERTIPELGKNYSYINLSQENITQYPHLIAALNNATSGNVKLPRTEWYALKDLFGSYAPQYILYQGKLFSVRLEAVDG